GQNMGKVIYLILPISPLKSLLIILIKLLYELNSMVGYISFAIRFAKYSFQTIRASGTIARSVPLALKSLTLKFTGSFT
ncbi:hypothetical protein MOE51_17605, partial [Bacillus inaquosorum]|nr:hypothetical protein [Bacillus inaquosorum]